MNKTVFISFDYDKDRRYRYLLSALNENSRFDLTFTDGTPREIQTDSISQVKAVLTRRINEATHTLVIVGQDANRLHADFRAIGERNWQHWESIEASKQATTGRGENQPTVRQPNTALRPRSALGDVVFG